LFISQRIPYKWTIDAPEEVETLDLGDIYSHDPSFVDEAQSS